MPAVLVNLLAILLGGGLGLFAGKLLPQRLSAPTMTALGLCTLWIGISGSLGGRQPLITIASLVLGTLAGTLLDIDGFFQGLGQKAQRLLQKSGTAQGPQHSLAEGFVAASLLFCVGAMAVTGSLSAGLRGDYATLYAKSALDFVAAILLASALGPGVLLSGLTVLVYQGGIVLLAGLLAPLLSDATIAEIGTAGSLMVLALGLNLLDISKIKVANLLPGILFAGILAVMFL